MLLKSKEEASFNKTALGIGRSSRNKVDPSRLFLITLRLSFDSYTSLKKILYFQVVNHNTKMLLFCSQTLYSLIKCMLESFCYYCAMI